MLRVIQLQSQIRLQPGPGGRALLPEPAAQEPGAETCRELGTSQIPASVLWFSTLEGKFARLVLSRETRRCRRCFPISRLQSQTPFLPAALGTDVTLYICWQRRGPGLSPRAWRGACCVLEAWPAVLLLQPALRGCTSDTGTGVTLTTTRGQLLFPRSRIFFLFWKENRPALF